jgi:cell division protein FtsN
LTDDAHDVAQLPTKLTLQLASYRLEAEAQKLAARLQASGFEARIAVQQKSKRPWYCVQTGSFERREDAEQYLAGLRAKNFAESYTLREVD